MRIRTHAHWHWWQFQTRSTSTGTTVSYHYTDELLAELKEETVWNHNTRKRDTKVYTGIVTIAGAINYASLVRELSAKAKYIYNGHIGHQTYYLKRAERARLRCTNCGLMLMNGRIYAAMTQILLILLVLLLVVNAIITFTVLLLVLICGFYCWYC